MGNRFSVRGTLRNEKGVGSIPDPTQICCPYPIYKLESDVRETVGLSKLEEFRLWQELMEGRN